MKNLKLLSAAALAAVVTAVGASPGRADVISYSTSSPIPPTLTDWSASLTFPTFDSSLGTLTSVRLDLSGSFGTTITVNNTGDTSSSGTANTEVQFTVQDVGLNLTAPELDLFSPSFGYSLGAGGSTSSGLLTQGNIASNTYSSAPVLTEFTSVGPNFIGLPASTFTQTLLANTGGNTSASQITEAGMSGIVYYTYNAVPEPSTLVLLAVGAAGLLAYVGQRRKKAA